MKDKNPPEAQADGKAERLMYIGPTILDPILLPHRGVFRALPDSLKTLPREKQEALEECFVPLSRAAAALRELEGAKPAGQTTKKYHTAQRLARSKK